MSISPRLTEMRCTACGCFHYKNGGTAGGGGGCRAAKLRGMNGTAAAAGNRGGSRTRVRSASPGTDAYMRAEAAMSTTADESSPRKDGPPHPHAHRRAAAAAAAAAAAQQQHRSSDPQLRHHMTVLIDAFEELRGDHDALVSNIDRVVEQKVAAALAKHHHAAGGGGSQSMVIVPPQTPSPSPIYPVAAAGHAGAAYYQPNYNQPRAASAAAHDEAEHQAMYSRVRHLTTKLAEEKKQRADDVRDITLQMRQLRITVDSLRGQTTAVAPTTAATSGAQHTITVAEVREIVKEMEPQLIAKVNTDLHTNAEHFRKLLTKHQDLVQSVVTEGQATSSRKLDTKSSSLETELASLKGQLQEHQSATRRALSSMSQTLHISAPVL